jgi:2-keto-4-pentenoate hydratase/2-oxohepta-3-ene-1,7-dioic acid hydratase in catechol pathway
MRDERRWLCCGLDHLTGRHLALKDAIVHVVTTELGLGRIKGPRVLLLSSPYAHLGQVLEATGSLDVLADAPVVGERSLGELAAIVQAPLGRPHAVWGVGLNYHSKAELTGRPVPTEPIIYLAAGSAVRPGGSVEFPTGQTTQMDYEAEIAVIVGRRLYRADPGEVWSHLAGITAANDMTARDVMTRTKAPTLAKSFPGFNPLGPSVLSIDELADRDRIGVRSRVNGEARQQDTSAGLIFDIPDLVARISWYAALEPGDVIMTGTPAGTGQDRNEFLHAGDEVVIEVDGVLPLTNRIGAVPCPQPAAALAEASPAAS